jgi:large conductance mechanosensitive channel
MGILEEFKTFAMRGNVVDLAVGFTVGAAFSTVARSLVDDIIMPPVGLLLGQSDFADKFILLREGTPPPPYATLADAQAAGAVTWNWGLFINSIITFIIVALAMFFIIRAINRLDQEMEKDVAAEPEKVEQEPANKKCPYCFSTIPYEATRCPQCTSQLEPVDAAPA